MTASGELKSAGGYVVGWKLPEFLRAVEARADGPVRPMPDLPKPLQLPARVNGRGTPTRAGAVNKDGKRGGPRIVPAVLWPLALASVLLARIPVPDGPDGHDARFKIGCAIHHDFDPGADGRALWLEWLERGGHVCREGAPCVDKWAGMADYSGDRAGIGTLLALADMSAVQALAAMPSVEIIEQHQGPSLVSHGKSAPSLAAILERKGHELRHNVRWARPEHRTGPGDDPFTDWEPWDSFTEARVFDEISTGFVYVDSANREQPFRVTQGAPQTRQLLNAALSGRLVDPFLEYLEALPAPCHIPGQGLAPGAESPSIDRTFIDLFGAEDTPLNRWAGRHFWLAVVARTFNPGCKIE